jgi:hypothetical protein
MSLRADASERVVWLMPAFGDGGGWAQVKCNRRSEYEPMLSLGQVDHD